MTIVVVGGGAVGLLVAGRLARSSQRVALLARASTVHALQTQPLVLRQHGQKQSIAAPPVVADPADLPAPFQPPDLAILCVKGYDTPDALKTLDRLQPRQVLSLQNGIGNEERLAAQFGMARVLAGVITSSVQIDAPHELTITKAGGIALAAPEGARGVLFWGSLLARAGFAVRVQGDYRRLKWSKALLNLLGNATPAILDSSIEAVYADPRLLALERQAFLEALAVMQQQQTPPVNLPGYPTAWLAWIMRHMPPVLLFPLLRRLVAGGRGGKLPSLHADLRRGRTQSEGALLYGAIAEAAQAVGLAAPVNAALWHALGGIAAGDIDWAHFRQQPQQLFDLVARTTAAQQRALHDPAQ